MKNNFFKVLTVLSVGIMVTFASCQTEDVQMQEEISIEENRNGELIPDQYIVVLKENKVNTASFRTSKDYNFRKAEMKIQAVNLLQSHQVEAKAIDQVYNKAIYGFSVTLDKQELERLRNDESVAYIEQDRLMVLAPPPGKGPGGGNGGGSTSQSTPWGITRVGGAADGTGKTAWVIDTGVDLDHPDLNVDVSRSITVFTSGRDANSADDGNGHGSHVAGTIAAIDNSQGVVGVAAGATVVGVKVLDSRGSGSYSGVIAGVDYVGANASAGDVANMSLGGPVSQALDDAVVAASSNGVIFTLAAGNDTDDANNHSPARANGKNIYTISAMDDQDVMAYFSNYGNPPVDFAAPGVSVTSTYKDGGYTTYNGTSMAAPHAAGVLLLGPASSDGNVIGDFDSAPDPIIHR